jgi:hypothetical protein
VKVHSLIKNYLNNRVENSISPETVKKLTRVVKYTSNAKSKPILMEHSEVTGKVGEFRSISPSQNSRRSSRSISKLKDLPPEQLK